MLKWKSHSKYPFTKMGLPEREFLTTPYNMWRLSLSLSKYTYLSPRSWSVSQTCLRNRTIHLWCGVWSLDESLANYFFWQIWARLWFHNFTVSITYKTMILINCWLSLWITPISSSWIKSYPDDLLYSRDPNSVPLVFIVSSRILRILIGRAW